MESLLSYDAIISRTVALTTCSSKILGNYVPSYTAEAVLNLERAGAVINEPPDEPPGTCPVFQGFFVAP